MGFQTMMQKVKQSIRNFWPVRQFLNSNAWHILKYRSRILFQKRENRVYTKFFRSPNQFAVLRDKVIPFVRNGSADETLRIVVLGCSTGAEPFSIASELRSAFPDLQFKIKAFDLVPDVVAKARTAEYTREEVHLNPLVTDEFISRTFDIDGETYRVKEELQQHVEFGEMNVLEPGVLEKCGKAQLVFAQNFLFHLEPPDARRAFETIVGLLENHAALLIDGMDTGMRVQMTKKFDLEPVEDRIREVHEDARLDRGANWSSCYWGRPPFDGSAPDWQRRFGTVYLKRT